MRMSEKQVLPKTFAEDVKENYNKMILDNSNTAHAHVSLKFNPFSTFPQNHGCFEIIPHHV